MAGCWGSLYKWLITEAAFDWVNADIAELGTSYFVVNDDGTCELKTRVENGTGDAGANLEWKCTPQGSTAQWENIYNADGALTGERTVDTAGNDLNIIWGGKLNLWDAGSDCSGICSVWVDQNTVKETCCTATPLAINNLTGKYVPYEIPKVIKEAVTPLNYILATPVTWVVDAQANIFPLQNIGGWTWVNSSNCDVKLYLNFLYNTTIEDFSQDMSFNLQDRYQVRVNGTIILNNFVQHGGWASSGRKYNVRDYTETELSVIIPKWGTANIEMWGEIQSFDTSWGSVKITPSVKDVNIIAYPV